MSKLLTQLFYKNKTINLVFIILMIVGLFCYFNISKEAEPDVKMPYIYISMNYQGISPEDSERLLLRPVEKKLTSVKNLKTFRSTATENHASIFLEFDIGSDSKKAIDDIREVIDQVKSKLPEGTSEPNIREISLATQNPILKVVISGSIPESKMNDLSKRLKENLEKNINILEVKQRGNRDEFVEINISPMFLSLYQINLKDVYNYIQKNNTLIPAGNLQTGEGSLDLSVPSVIENITDILTTPVKSFEQEVIIMSDIAEVKRTFKDAESSSSLDNKKMITLEVMKKPGKNIIDTVDIIRTIVKENTQSWPVNINASLISDRSVQVKEMLNELNSNIILSIILVSIVVCFYLGITSSVYVFLAIPCSILLGITMLTALGITINIVVMFALIMSVGLLVDGSIVVVEDAKKNLENGETVFNSYLKSSKRMAIPIFSSTLTTILAFMPLMFWPGIMGDFMKYLPITMIAVLFSSFLIAIIFIPIIASQIRLKNKSIKKVAVDSFLANKYQTYLKRIIKKPKMFVALIITMLFMVCIVFVFFNRGIEFFPKIDATNIIIKIKADKNLSLEHKEKIMNAALRKVENVKGVDFVLVKTTSNQRETSIGQLDINLLKWDQREKSKLILNQIKSKLDEIYGIKYIYIEDKKGPKLGRDIKIILSSNQYAKLAKFTSKFAKDLSQINGIKNIENNIPMDQLEWDIQVNKKIAAEYGTTTEEIGSYIQMISNGLLVGTFYPDDLSEEIDIRVRFPKDFRSINQLDETRIMTPNGQVPLSKFIKISLKNSNETYRKVDGNFAFNILADAEDSSKIYNINQKISKLLSNTVIPQGISIKIEGERSKTKESEQFLKHAFLIALFCILIVLVTQFNSYSQALMIISAIIFSTIGSLITLIIFNQPFGIVMSGIGIIALAGIVVNNNIVLIDTFNSYKNASSSLDDIILKTGLNRLRPVLLTTITTVFGLLPMVFKFSFDFVNLKIQYDAPSAQMWSQLSLIVCGGLIFSTFLTLFVTPCLLKIFSKKHASKLIS